MTAPSIVIVGAGGHAAVIIDAIRSGGAFTPVAVVDPAPEGAEVLGVPVVGDDTALPKLLAGGVGLAVIAIGLNRLRHTLGDALQAQGFGLPPIIHPTALVSPSARIGEGAVIMARANVGPRAVVGRLAVVSDLPDGAVVGGAPARPLRARGSR